MGSVGVDEGSIFQMINLGIFLRLYLDLSDELMHAMHESRLVPLVCICYFVKLFVSLRVRERICELVH